MPIESIGRAPLLNLVSTHANTISRASTSIISSATSLVLVICAFLIILWLSGVAFLITVGTLALIVGTFWFNEKRIADSMAAFTVSDNHFVDVFGEVLDCFKALKMNPDKSRDFIESHLKPLTLTAYQARIQTGF